MDLNTISKSSKWYLFKVTGYFKGFNKMVITDAYSMNYYNLEPGTYVKIHNLKQHNAQKTFLIMPYMKKYKWNLELLTEVNEFNKTREINKAYKKIVDELITSFNLLKEDPKGLRIIDEINNYEAGSLAVPESWFYEYCSDLGEMILLRNDQPSPIIF